MEKNEYSKMYKYEDTYWWYKGLHELVEHYVKKESYNKNLKIFDAGCGTGKMLSILKKYGDVQGIDYSKDAIDFCRKRKLDNVSVEDLNIWNSNGELYDIIVCLDVLYHSGIKDDLYIINKFYESLNINGLLILNLPAFNCLKRKHTILVGGKKRYRKSLLIPIQENIGLHPTLSTYRLAFLFPIILIKKLIESFSFSSRMESDLNEIHPFLNSIFLFINRIENFLILKGVTIPFGSSLFIIGKKLRL